MIDYKNEYIVRLFQFFSYTPYQVIRTSGQADDF